MIRTYFREQVVQDDYLAISKGTASVARVKQKTNYGAMIPSFLPNLSKDARI
jgi:hypothetical protein